MIARKEIIPTFAGEAHASFMVLNFKFNKIESPLSVRMAGIFCLC